EALNRRLVVVIAKELQKMPDPALVRLARAVRRSTILAQILQESRHLPIGPAEGLRAPRFEMPECLQERHESSQSPSETRIPPPGGEAAVRGSQIVFGQSSDGMSPFLPKPCPQVPNRIQLEINRVD